VGIVSVYERYTRTQDSPNKGSDVRERSPKSLL